MLRCYNRYIIRSLIGPLFLITFTLTGIVWLTQSLRFIDLIVNRGLSVTSFLYLSSLLVPFLLSIVLPVSLFCAVTFVYYKFIMDSELVVLKSVGLSRFALAKPALIVALFVVIFSYILSLYVIPTSYREFRELQLFIRDNYASMLLQEGVFNTPVKGLTVYIESREKNGMLKGLLVHDSRNADIPVTMMAEQGRLVQTPGGPRFDMLNGNRQSINQQNGQLSLLHFDRYILDIGNVTKVREGRRRDPRERYLHELFYPSEADAREENKLRTEGHQRLTWPLYNGLMVFISLAALLSGQFNRRGQWKRIWIATVFAVLLVVLGVSQVNIVAKNPTLTPLMYSNVLVIAAICIFIVLQKQKKVPRTLPEEV